jgi:hypothetical protein
VLPSSGKGVATACELSRPGTGEARRESAHALTGTASKAYWPGTVRAVNEMSMRYY